MNKKPIAKIKLTLLANKAAPSPYLGQVLGQYGINIMEFCKNFNSQTINLKQHVYIPTIIYLYTRDDFKVEIKTPSTSYLVKQIANLAKGSSMPKKKPSGFINLKEIYHLALLKKCEQKSAHLKIKAICKTILGSIKSMGLTINK